MSGDIDNWTDWIDIDLAKSKRGQFNNFGIYEIRVVDSRGQPIPISRLIGVDYPGVLYIGRSGLRNQKTKRTIANRIQEFLRQKNHSGGITYARAKKILQQEKKFSGHRLQVRAIFLADEEIKSKEAKVLRDYFSIHAELPPCNSALPKKQ
jgi:hypothetical protein